jgi:uncharacterized protein (UPF0297 family)
MILEHNNERIIIKAKSKPIIEIPEEGADQGALLFEICEAIREGGYNPVSQIVGYIISEDPTHITNYKNARTLIGKIDRDELLEQVVAHYISTLDEKYNKGKETK